MGVTVTAPTAGLDHLLPQCLERYEVAVIKRYRSGFLTPQGCPAHQRCDQPTALDPCAPIADPTTLWLPTLGRAIPRPWFLPDAETLETQRRIMESSYFLVSIRGSTSPLGEWLRCDPKKGGCGAKHDYLTLRCVPQPFSGITGGLFAYYRAIGDNGLVGQLRPPERARYDALTNALGGIPDLSASHPETARALTRGLAANDAQIGAVALGVLEPIPVTLARKYRDRIRARGCRPRFDLPGMED